MSLVSDRFRRIQEDNDSKFHYLQKKLEKFGLAEYSRFMCPICGKLLEKDEPTFGMRHPVCTNCLLGRTAEVKEQLERDHPEMVSMIEPLRKYAEDYFKKRNKQ